MSDELIFDAWSPLSFKQRHGARSQVALGWSPPSWVGEHARRLEAYTILRAYVDNTAREFSGAETRAEIDRRREYGDAALLANAIMGALLGEGQTIAVEGADEETPEPGAVELQGWLQAWADDERLGLKMIETERRAVTLGDGVYSLGWNDEKGRPRLRVWDPGFYFPVLDDGNEDDFPKRVHIAWEYEDDAAKARGKVKVRRITWEMGPIVPANVPGLLAGLFTEPELQDGDRWAEDGRIERDVPWSDDPVTQTCYLTDATWTLDRAKQTVDDLTEADAEYTWDVEGPINRRDLFLDFIPVVHVPNTVSLLEHYGRSSLATILQILDDLSAADTDLAGAAATTGTPPIALQGATMGGKSLTYRPGEILETGDGKMTVLDTSKSLDALIKYVEFLLKRLSVNSRTPEAVLGRVTPSEVPSGLALALGFGPLEQMVGEMRLVRDEKYPLLLKFAHRIALANGADGVPTETLRAEVQLGTFMPQDQAEAVKTVTQLLVAKAISLETAVGILIDAGFPIKDALKEVEAIQSRDFESANLLLEALGSPELVAEFLGRELPQQPRRVPRPAPGAEDEGIDDTELGPDGEPI